MASVTNPYDELYTNLKNRCDVTYDGYECSIGECMLRRAGKSQMSSTTAVTPVSAASRTGVSTIFDYMSDKLVIKTAPKKERTLRRFPIRTSVSAILSAVAACALVFTFGIFALTGSPVLSPYTAEAPETVITENEPEAETIPDVNEAE